MEPDELLREVQKLIPNAVSARMNSDGNTIQVVENLPANVSRPILHWPKDQYYSASTGETLNIFSDNEPPAEQQVAWVATHPDAVRLRNCFEKRCPTCGQQIEGE